MSIRFSDGQSIFKYNLYFLRQKNVPSGIAKQKMNEKWKLRLILFKTSAILILKNKAYQTILLSYRCTRTLLRRNLKIIECDKYFDKNRRLAILQQNVHSL